MIGQNMLERIDTAARVLSPLQRLAYTARVEQQDKGTDALLALNATGRHIYGGTVAPHVVARRRAANKVARRSRRVNRARS